MRLPAPYWDDVHGVGQPYSIANEGGDRGADSAADSAGDGTTREADAAAEGRRAAIGLVGR
jgi:hypothetical protein